MELSFKDVVRIFAVSEQTVNGWIKKRRMPCITVNEQYRFNYIELLDWAIEEKVKLTPEILSLEDRANRGGEVLYQALMAGNVYYDVPGDNPEAVLKSVVDVLPLPPRHNKQSLWQMLIAREKLVSTAIGKGIAIPHVRNPVVLQLEKPSVTLCFLKKPVEFKALDGQPVFILFTLLSSSVKQHLWTLSRLAYCLQNEKLQEYLHQKAPREQILAEVRVLESTIPPVSDKDEKDKGKQ